jgi:predicted AAA+ superfamily ATPase
MSTHATEIPTQGDRYRSPNHLSSGNSGRPPLKYEQLVLWAVQEWQQRYPDQPYRVVWATENCAHNMALGRIKPGRRLRGKARYAGYQPVACPFSIPIDSFYLPARTVVLTDSVGAYTFSFECAGQAFDVIFASAHSSEACGHTTEAIALVPLQHLETWADFEAHCDRAAYRLERSEKVYIIGGADRDFKPTVEWDDIILSEVLKADLRADIETFYDEGVALYRQLNLPAFRKLLFVGPPGTGKSMLCAALAKLALARKCVVIYISASDKDEASFDKIQRALNITAHSQHPVLLVVEELDVYLKPEDKSQILNVLDGFEAPDNPRGALMIATTNYPEVIDERIAKRPGRIDRIIYIPEIQDEEQATRMLKCYMGAQWQAEHQTIAANLIGQTGAFVREVALYARMLALHRHEAEVPLTLLRQSLGSLTNQLSLGKDMQPRRPIGFLSEPMVKVEHSANLKDSAR